ncbi:hypothetical protein RFI_01427 [Reticulomyxa filosa]|uniref:Uncharacterized protein n=1 Tax=Reticulomyxa filosa TaxID=46433 RepID=X6PBS9_RETFI|nr:hypothetical protein RFI_01427 [Reticulomyxa filosa]|eukprot:ETO35636.1 hypothetical protein RFI_01427 [Reticulomyxa filosa]
MDPNHLQYFGVQALTDGSDNDDTQALFLALEYTGKDSYCKSSISQQFDNSSIYPSKSQQKIFPRKWLDKSKKKSKDVITKKNMIAISLKRYLNEDTYLWEKKSKFKFDLS